jgi:hypothetical protein
MEKEAKRRAEEFTEIMGRNPEEARKALESLLTGPLRFTPVQEPEGKRFRIEGSLALESLFLTEREGPGLPRQTECPTMSVPSGILHVRNPGDRRGAPAGPGCVARPAGPGRTQERARKSQEPAMAPAQEDAPAWCVTRALRTKPGSRSMCGASQRASIGPGMMKVTSILFLLPIAVLAASCIADVADAPDESVGDAVEPVKGPGSLKNLPRGPCATACLSLAAGQCGDWQGECADLYPDDENVTCAGQALSCRAAQSAAQDTVLGVGLCYRYCEHLDGYR